MKYILESIPDPIFCLKVEEYEHLQFLWGRGQSIVTFPAILSLLSDYHEVWFDATETGLENPKAAHSKISVPWIPQKQIDLVRELGNYRIDLEKNILVPNISAEKAIQLGEIDPFDYSVDSSDSWTVFKRCDEISNGMTAAKCAN